MSRTILVLSSDSAATAVLRQQLAPEGDMVIVSRFASAYDFICNEMPLLFIVDLAGGSDNAHHVNLLKDDPLFSGLPVIALLDDQAQLPDWETVPVDDYLRRKDLEEEIAARTRLCRYRAQRVVEVNPLTRLPGNISINRQIQERLDRKDAFAIAYADLDHFKPYNDTYGFSRGDDVLRITGRLLLNITKTRQPRDSFVGHIGGDDFVVITGSSVIEDVCREVITAFDRIILSFYDPEDRERGYIRGHDRAGRERQFPFLGISLGVVYSERGPFSHYGEMTEIAAEVKSFAKEQEGSCYRLNRRMYPYKPSP